MSPVGNRTKQELNVQTKSCQQDLANYKHRTASLQQSPSSSLSSAIQREETMKYSSNSCDIDDKENSFYEHSFREKIYDQFKRSTSYGGIETNSNFKRFSLKNQDNNFNFNNSIGSAGYNSNSYDRKNHDEDPEIARSGEHDDDNIAVSDIIGSFGLFQAIVLLFSGLREGLVGYDALVMSIILQPDPDRCKWPIVCQNYWMMVVIESAYFLGLVTGNLIWGYCADKFGRRPAYLAAHTMSILFGSLAIFMPSVYLFAVCRFLTAFGSIGYNIIYSIQVELIGLRHRSFSTILNHLGWGLGVICVPLVDHLIDDYRTILSIAPILSLAMFPWAFWLPESSRWLMANGEFEKARHELIRVAKFNGRQITPRIEKSIWVLEQRVRAYKLEQEQQSGKVNNSYKLIFTNPILVRDTLILAYLAFVGHLFYYVQTLNFAHIKNLSTEANFITSGAGEWVSVIVGAILLKFFSRKTCMSLFLLIMTCSFAFQSLVDSGIIPALDTVLIITTNNGLGTLSSLLLIFIALIVNQEVYPTIVRQTGTSLIGSIGESGSLLAPLLIYISSVVGPEKSNAAFTLFCIFGIVAAQFLTKTDDIELPDT